MSFLVDANVLSEATKPEPNRRVMEWLKRHETQITVDPIILGELRFGILLLPAGKRRERLEVWFDGGIAHLDCAVWDVDCALRWAELLADLRARGESMPIKDSLIAATALVHELVVVTRNSRDFAKARVAVVDPFSGD